MGGPKSPSSTSRMALVPNEVGGATVPPIFDQGRIPPVDPLTLGTHWVLAALRTITSYGSAGTSAKSLPIVLDAGLALLAGSVLPAGMTSRIQKVGGLVLTS